VGKFAGKAGETEALKKNRSFVWGGQKPETLVKNSFGPDFFDVDGGKILQKDSKTADRMFATRLCPAEHRGGTHAQFFPPVPGRRDTEGGTVFRL